MTITVDIDSPSKARKFLYIAKNMKFVRDARISDNNLTPLTDEDWIKPGRPATEEEIEARLQQIENDIAAGSVYTLDEARESTRKYIETLSNAKA